MLDLAAATANIEGILATFPVSVKAGAPCERPAAHGVDLGTPQPGRRVP
jgi:hypothetical protein